MKQTVTKTVSIHKIDYRLYSTNMLNAPFQLEIYHTKEEPGKNIGVLNNNTKKFSYKIGDIVDVAPKVNVSSSTFLTNIVMNTFLQNYMKTK